MHKATGGLIRAEFLVESGIYRKVSFAGDYFCFPQDTVNRLARHIEGSSKDEIVGGITDFYNENDFELPGIGIDDWLKVLGI